MKNVEYAEHTLEQYAAMTKAQRVDAKDVGFFIGGHTEKRKVTYRQILSLDIDDANEDTLAELRKWLDGHTYILHSTHSSTPTEPRYRVVAPLNRYTSADEYGAMMRVLHDKFKLPLDVATFDFNRIMFLPSVPKDAEYFFEDKVGDPINVDDLLKELKNWQDLSNVQVPKKIQVQDPLKKGGIIGAFCNRVSIREAIETYLSEKWRPESDGSYTLIGASTTSGGKIFEGKYFVSFHSTDPYLGKSHNAYDAIRLYKFGGGKAGEAGMAALCEELGVKAEDGSKVKLALDELDDDEAKTILKERLTFTKQGELEKTIENVELILTYDPALAGLFGYDMFTDAPVLKRMPYWRTSVDIRTPGEDCRNIQEYEGMEDVDESRLRKHLEKHYGLRGSDRSVQDALNIVVQDNSFHPIREYLNSLEWDGIPRLETIFIDCFGVADTLYSREVGLKFFVGAVRRVFIPASKMDYIPVLVSDEGRGKSRFIRRMAKIWGSDTFYTFNGSKEAYEQLRGVWIMEIPELNGIQNRSTNSRKAFVTKGEDRYRSAYLKYTKTYKRQCVFIASSNDVVFLDDPSEDGRRWWGLMCNPDNVKINVHSDEFLDLVDDYWAEAVHYYRQGVKPMLSDAAEVEARRLRQVHKAEDMEIGALIDYLNMPVPEDWKGKTLFERIHYWKEERNQWHGAVRDTVCATEVAREFFEIPRSVNMKSEARRVNEAIRATGLFTQDGSKARFGEYGVAIAWIRKTSIVKTIKESKK
ncbi:MAG: hypothetical protein GX025_10115 [Clostridiales bacterium]|nr:hypothetical protein [Clostridiales bacterium]